MAGLILKQLKGILPKEHVSVFYVEIKYHNPFDRNYTLIFSEVSFLLMGLSAQSPVGILGKTQAPLASIMLLRKCYVFRIKKLNI